MSKQVNLRILLEVVGLMLGFFSGTGMLWALLDPCWKISSQDLSVQPYDICYGLWIGCTLPSDGSWICDGFGAKTVIDLNAPSRTHFCRASLICGFILCVTSLLTGGVGSNCCRTDVIFSTVKSRLRRFTSFLFFLQGLLVAGAGSWYLIEIYKERVWFHNSVNLGIGYTIGRAIWITLGSALLCFISGLCFCFCCNENTESRESYKMPSHYYVSDDVTKKTKYETRSEYV